MKILTPKARTENIVVQDLNDEVLLYDLKINRAYCLNETAAIVYRHCDGEKSFAELRRASGKNLSDEVIRLAIEELSRLDLLREKVESGVSRRTLIQKAAVSAAALPLITMIVAPSAAHAASGEATCINEGGEPNGTVVGQSDSQLERFCFFSGSQCCSDNAVPENCEILAGGFTRCDCVCRDIPPPL